MATKPGEDPMDLGPFLQNYVLKNPFHDMFMAGGAEQRAQSARPSPAQSQSATKINSNKCTVQSLLQNKRHTTIGSVSQISVLDGSGEGVPGRPRVKAGRKSKYAAAIASLKQKDMALDLSLSDPYKLRQAESPSPTALECVDMSGKQEAVDDNPDDVDSNVSGRELSGEAVKGGHVGSNWAFAEALKKSSVKPNHVKIQSWLRDNYRYITNYKTCDVSTRQVLRHVQETFPYITATFLNRIVAVMFPGCVRVNKRATTYYEGLVAKPDEGTLEKAEFNVVFKKVVQGLLTIPEAEKLYTLDSSIVGALLWCSTELESSGDLSPAPSDHHSPGDPDTHQSTFGDGEEPAWKRRRRSSGGRLDSEDSDSESADFEMMLRDIQGQPTGTPVHDIHNEVRDYRNVTSPHDRTRNSTGVCMIGRVQSATRSIDEPVVKAEPTASYLQVVDNDGNTIDVSDSLDLSVTTSKSAERLAIDQDTDVTQPDDAHQIPEKSSADRRVSELKKQLVRAQKDIKQRDRACIRLRSDLKSAQDSVLAQQEELNTRDFHLAHLAEDFFKLHDQFKQLARQFQLVLGETQQQNLSARNGFVQNGTLEGHI